MKLSALIAALRIQVPLVLLRFARDVQALTRIDFLYAAIDSGLLEEVRTPSTKKELVTKLEVRRPELLEALLAGLDRDAIMAVEEPISSKGGVEHG